MDVIEVTEEHIAVGKPKNTQWCPVALALSEASGGLKFDVGIYTALCYDRVLEQSIKFELPGVVSMWIIDFDRGKPVGPIRFRLSGGEEVAER